MGDILQRIKTILGIDNQDNLLEEIFNITAQKLLTIINQDTIPIGLEWIAIELTIERFNRIGSEGVSSESVDGKSITYNEDDLLKYKSYIDDYMIRNNIKSKSWRLF